MENENNQAITYFCEKCGDQLPNEATICPQCGTSISKHPHIHNKMIIVIPLIVIITALITTVSSFFTLRYLNNKFPIKDESYAENVSEETDDYSADSENEILTSSVSSICPANEYGNHDWENPTCTQFAKCQNCGAYKDDKLGNHYWVSPTCIQPARCFHCDVYKEDGKLGNHDWWVNDYDIKECFDCNLLYEEYIKKDEVIDSEVDEVLDGKLGLVESIYTASDIPDVLMNDKFKNVVDLFSKGFSQSGLNISNATTYDDGEHYIFYFDDLEFLGEECDDSHLRPRIIYSGDAIENNGSPNRIYFGFYNPLKSNGYWETVEMVEEIAEALDISDSGLIDNDYSGSSKIAIGEYATFTFTNLNLELIVSNTDAEVEIEIVPID